MVPMSNYLLIDNDSIYVIVGKQIIFQMERGKFGEAVVAFVAVFYLLDYDYPKHWEIGMNML